MSSFRPWSNPQPCFQYAPLQLLPPTVTISDHRAMLIKLSSLWQVRWLWAYNSFHVSPFGHNWPTIVDCSYSHRIPCCKRRIIYISQSKLDSNRFCIPFWSFKIHSNCLNWEWCQKSEDTGTCWYEWEMPVNFGRRPCRRGECLVPHNWMDS